MISPVQESPHSSHKTINFKDKETQQKFDVWMSKSRQTQIRAVTAVTGLLYIIAYITDVFVAPKEILTLLTVMHLMILPPYLFLISLATFKKEISKLTIFLLALSPIVAAIGNLIIVSGLENPSMRLTEIYLILFWIFTISGLRLKHATISASIIFIMVILVSYIYFTLTFEYFVMHCFWMSVSYSLAFLGAYLIETSNKAIFTTQEQLKHLAVTDKLTGLYNRTKLDEIMKEELNRAKRYHHTFGLVLMDFDNFKHINDSYGHQVGDEVLIEISTLITNHLRSSDKVVRWGGEEFIIIYLDVTHDEMQNLAEGLRQKIENHRFKTVGTCTASLGVTLYQDNDTIDTIIHRADQALYKAKTNGKNRIEF